MSRILVVEDEPAIAELISINLRHAGFEVTIAGDAEQAQVAVDGILPSLVVLDWMLPGQSGLALARAWRAQPRTRELPIIMLTARADEGDKVAGLDAGADDYLAKPFSASELLARIRAVLRRIGPEDAAADGAPTAAARPALRIGNCTFDTAARCLRDPDGGEIALTAMEFDLLDVFARHPRQTLSRSRLAELAHGRPLAPGDRSIDIRITRLRAKIGEDARTPRTLRTVHGEGYLFDPDS